MRAPIAVGVRKSNGVPCTGGKLAGRDQRAVDRRVAVRLDHQLVPEHVAAARQVEVGVLGQVDRRRLVGGRVIVDDQLVAIGQLVGDPHVEVAGISFFPVGAAP